jgi:hypothetical protein
MKRFAIAVAIALSAVPALAEQRDAPFEQTQLDRALPSLPETVATDYARIPSERMPFEQTQLDRGSIGDREVVLLAQVGSMSYKSVEQNDDSAAAWENDHNFIAPAQ